MLFILIIILGMVLGLLCNVFDKNGNNQLNNFKLNGRDYLLIYAILVGRLVVILFKIQSLLIISEVLNLILILVMMCLNRKEVGILIIGIGSILNYIVMIFNDGKMPVKTNLPLRLWDIKHSILNNTTHLKWLSDNIFIPNPLGIGVGIASVGDFILAIGLSIICFKLVRSINLKTNKIIKK